MTADWVRPPRPIPRPGPRPDVAEAARTPWRGRVWVRWMGSDPTWGHQVVCDSMPGMGDVGPVILARCQFGDVAGRLADLATRAAMANLDSPAASPAACDSADHVNCGCLLSTPTAGQPDPLHFGATARPFIEDDRRRERRRKIALLLFAGAAVLIAGLMLGVCVGGRP